ncbi:Reticulocalbin-1 [Microtus ochrogaster]|uniref:Reticulocalbin-1 n=1 Tax=Microtus ochrogaster TaxID=79684 RepID=A0A8J6KQG1_MICOH|nr:Reticulocalbin-1 [Microtus ochrogaster]
MSGVAWSLPTPAGCVPQPGRRQQLQHCCKPLLPCPLPLLAPGGLLGPALGLLVVLALALLDKPMGHKDRVVLLDWSWASGSLLDNQSFQYDHKACLEKQVTKTFD